MGLTLPGGDAEAPKRYAVVLAESVRTRLLEIPSRDDALRVGRRLL